MTGGYIGSILNIGTQSYSYTANNDGYIAKFDPGGNPLWGRIVTGPGQDYCYSCSAYTGGVYLCGGVSPGNFTIGNYNFTTPPGNENMFIANYDSNGNLLFANTLPGGGDDQSSIVSINACSAVVAGDYGINSFPLGNTTLLRTAPGEPIFLAKFDMVPLIYVPGKSTCPAQIESITASGMSTYTWSNNTFSSTLTVSPLATTVYTVTGNSVCGTASAMVTVSVSPSPTINVAVSSDSVCAGAQIVLTASGANSFTWSGGVINGVPFVPNFSTNYTVSGSNSLPCPGITTVSILVVPFPTIALVASPNPMCLGNSATLTAQGANSYTWLAGMGNQPDIVVSPTVTTTYTVLGADLSNNCTATNTIEIVVDNCTGVEKWAADSEEIKVYPNPNPGELILELNTVSGETQFLLFNDNGQRVYRRDCIAGKNKFDLTGITNGIYYWELVGGHISHKSGKIICNHTK